MVELIIFAAFLVLQAGAKALPNVATKISHFAIVQRISKHHWVVWICHPTVLHGIHDYAIHFVVYSGYVITH